MAAVRFIVTTTCRVRPFLGCNGWHGRSVTPVASESAIASFMPVLAQTECQRLFTATGINHG